MLADGNEAHSLDSENVLPRMQAFGYTTETMQFMLLPMELLSCLDQADGMEVMETMLL